MGKRLSTVIFMFNLTSSAPKSWQTVSRQADRVNHEPAAVNHAAHMPPPRDLGGVLRERREAMGASLAEVETATRIRQKYLAALESDEWHLLPGEVVGRGFLRNYATYLGLDPTEIVERRRTVADPLLAAALSGTSAGSALPPERDVDYRPKDVLLKDEPEGIQQREMRVGPFFTIVLLGGVLLLVWWGISNFGSEISASIGTMIAEAQTRVQTPNPAIATALPTIAGNEPLAVTPGVTEDNRTEPIASVPDSNNTAGAQATPPAQATPAAVATEAPKIILVPSDTPTPSPTVPVEPSPTNTLEPTPLPTNTPLPPTETPPSLPTATPTPLVADIQPAVVAPFCADERMAFFAPGVGQVLSGVVSITGRATDDDLDYYKIEYAVGANADSGFIYFDGRKERVEDGILGTLNTGSLPNGEYTLQLTIVDLTGNYPPPCRVSVVIKN